MLHVPRIIRRTAITIALFLFTTLCWAQKDTGNIVRTVRDQSRALIPNATVTVEDVNRGTTFQTSTKAREYVAGPLKIGRYRVIVEKQGFKKTPIGPVELNLQERPSVDVTLHVGAISEQVVVTSQGPQLETENSDLGQVVTSQRILSLPLNGRNYAQLAQLSAGVAPARVASFYPAPNTTLGGHNLLTETDHGLDLAPGESGCPIDNNNENCAWGLPAVGS